MRKFREVRNDFDVGIWLLGLSKAEAEMANSISGLWPIPFQIYGQFQRLGWFSVYPKLSVDPGLVFILFCFKLLLKYNISWKYSDNKCSD